MADYCISVMRVCMAQFTRITNTYTDFFIRARENEMEHSVVEEDTHEEKTVKVC